MSKIIPAAGLIILKQNDTNFEVLLLKRNPNLKVHGGEWVFPGGKMEAGDFQALDYSLSQHEQTSPELLAEHDFLKVARQTALRETYEEAGILLTEESVEYHSRWLTPKALNKRFDTCFFISETRDKNVKVDGSEIIDYQWITPADSLVLHQDKKIAMPPATFVTLSRLKQFTDARMIIEYSHQNARHYRPKLISTENGLCALYQDDAGYQNEDYHARGKQHRLRIKSGHYEYICDHEN